MIKQCSLIYIAPVIETPDGTYNPKINLFVQEGGKGLGIEYEGEVSDAARVFFDYMVENLSDDFVRAVWNKMGHGNGKE